MNYRFLNSISNDEVADFRNRLRSALVARVTEDGKRIISDMDADREIYQNLSDEDAKKYLQTATADKFDYNQLADVVAAKYRTFTEADVENTRKAMVAEFMRLAAEHGWDMKQAEIDAKTEFYENTPDEAIRNILRNGESIADYVEYVSIYG